MISEEILLPLSRPAAEKLLHGVDIIVKQYEESFFLCREAGIRHAFVETSLAFWVDLQSTLKTLLEK